jgi:SAM-dependent methyltransferase
MGWKQFFDVFAPHYVDEVFTRNTVAEVDFLEEVLGLLPGASVVDVGCGTGRHSVELARRGYRVTGADISQGMLREAAHAAKQAGVHVEFICQDARELKLGRQFDACICLCEGSLGLLNADEDPLEHDIAILRGIAASLVPGGKFVLTALNALRKIRAYSDKDVARGKFNNLTLCEASLLSAAVSHRADVVLPEEIASATVMEKGFTAMELTLMLQIAGLRVENVWGGTAGSWGKRPLLMDEIELMVVARLD